MLNFVAVDLNSLRERGEQSIFEDDPDLWETDFVFRVGDLVLAGSPSRDKNLGIYFQPKIGTDNPVILLKEIDEIYEVQRVEGRHAFERSP